MKKRRFSRSVRFLLFVPILVILLLAARGAPEQVQAGKDDLFACWASGPLSDGSDKILYWILTNGGIRMMSSSSTSGTWGTLPVST